MSIHLFKGPINAGPCQPIDGTGDCYIDTLSDNVILASTGTFTWSIPTNLPGGNDYHIKIESSLDLSLWNWDEWLTRRFELSAIVCDKPISDFTYTITNFTALFTDTSTNTPRSWLWNFGDNLTSTSQNPSHTYTTSGNKAVTLTATNGCGTGTTITKTINISPTTTTTTPLPSTTTTTPLPTTTTTPLPVTTNNTLLIITAVIAVGAAILLTKRQKR